MVDCTNDIKKYHYKKSISVGEQKKRSLLELINIHADLVNPTDMDSLMYESI